MTKIDTTLTVRFFARFREQLNTESLQLSVSPGQTVADIMVVLATRGGPWQELRSDQSVMVAVNQAMAKPSTPVKTGDEVAFFPPVTGG